MGQLVRPLSNIVTFIVKNALTEEIEKRATVILGEGFRWFNDIIFS